VSTFLSGKKCSKITNVNFSWLENAAISAATRLVPGKKWNERNFAITIDIIKIMCYNL